METLLAESRSKFLEMFSALEKNLSDANSSMQRHHEKKMKKQEEEIRVLKEKLAKKDEILNFHEQEINALRNQVMSLKSEKPLCPSCSLRDGAARALRKRHFSPDSSCGRSGEMPPLSRRSGANCSGKRRRTGPQVLVSDTCPEDQNESPDVISKPFDRAFCLEKTPEEKAVPVRGEVKSEPSVRLGLNDLSPASAATQSLDLTIGPTSTRPLEGPKLGDTVMEDSQDTLLSSPPLLSLTGAAAASRRPSLPRCARSGRQLKLHSLSFAPKVNLLRCAERLQSNSSSAANFQDLDETVLEASVPLHLRDAPKMQTRSRSGRDLPTLGGSPTGTFKKPKAPPTKANAASRAEPSICSPESARKNSQLSGAETEAPSLDPIACSTLKGSADSVGFSLSSSSEAPESAVFAPPAVRRPLSPRNGEKSEGAAPVKPQQTASFKFAAGPERRKEERRKLPAFSCFECQEYYRGSGLSEEEIAERMKNCSRHRAKHPPPSTPEGFWDIDLPATPDNQKVPSDTALKRRRKPYQFPSGTK